MGVRLAVTVGVGAAIAVGVTGAVAVGVSAAVGVAVGADVSVGAAIVGNVIVVVDVPETSDAAVGNKTGVAFGAGMLGAQPLSKTAAHHTSTPNLIVRVRISTSLDPI
jgi:hypothetical protein